jgi:hypothetical protein
MPASGRSGWAPGMVAIVLGAWITTSASAASPPPGAGGVSKETLPLHLQRRFVGSDERPDGIGHIEEL